MYQQESSRLDPGRSRGRLQKDTHPVKDQLDQEELENIQDLKQ
jgi:hypothetical protein